MEKQKEKLSKVKEDSINKKTNSNMKTKIKKESNKLKKLFKSNSLEKSYIINKLIEKAAFLLVLSEQMETELKESDLSVETINASQSFIKANPLLKDYRDTVKSYQTVLKQLCDLTKNESSQNSEGPDELEQFLNNRWTTY